MDDKIRILLVDDHPILRRGLQLIIKSQKNFDVVGEASCLNEAIRLTDELSPDLVVLDMSLPDGNGIQYIQEVKTRHSTMKIIVLTVHDEEVYIKKVFMEGGNGYLLKKAADAELIYAIRAVSRGEMFLDSSLTRDFFEAMMNLYSKGKAGRVGPGELSARQREILVLISQGFTDKQIAEKLKISIKTVESHKARIKEKLNMTHRSELVQYVLRNGIKAEKSYQG